jgi:hypothetical protein
MSFLKNPVWQFVGVLVTFIAAVVSVIFYISDRPVKKLHVDILSNSPLVSINAEVPKEIQILYKGKPVQTLSLILLKLANTGTEPIRESDYSEPIRMSLSQSAEIGEVVVQETKPDGIPIAPTVVASNQVQLAKFLFNPGDQAVLKILALNNDSTLDIKARIAGVHQIEIQSVLVERSNALGNRPLRTWEFLILLFIIVAFAVVAVLIWESRKVMKWRQKKLGFDPASYYYTQAQRAMLRVSSSTPPTIQILNVATYFLDKAFTWDNAYVKKATNDALFSSLQGYERYRVVVDKHKSQNTDGRGMTPDPQ